jgi:hypothetical protein
VNAPVLNSYDVANARALCQASKCAYLAETPGVTRIVCEASDTVVLIDQQPNDLIISFRGTADLTNWLTDLDCAFSYLCLDSNAEVHAGFLKAWHSVRDEVLRAYVALAGNRRVWITGHSLGGALAVLAATDFFLQRLPTVCGCYTFGQPRTGNLAFREWYQVWLGARTFRVIHADDMVARIPWLLGAYRHVGHEVFYPSPAGSSSLAPQLDPPLWSKLPSDVRGLWRELAPCLTRETLCQLTGAIALRDWVMIVKIVRTAKIALLNDHHVNLYADLFA